MSKAFPRSKNNGRAFEFEFSFLAIVSSVKAMRSPVEWPGRKPY